MQNWSHTFRSLFPAVVLLTFSAAAAEIPAGFPQFVVPGHEPEMASIRALFWHHFQPAGPLIPLWDEWMPMATLWPAISTEKVNEMRLKWARALSSRPMNGEGYILTQQHDGPAHAEGWPFPLWSQAGGKGWHFRGTGVPGYDVAPSKPDGWTLVGGKGGEVDAKGWVIDLPEPHATLTTPPFAVEARIAPWLRLNWWAAGLSGANCYLEWTTKEAPEYAPERRMYFTPAHEGGDAHLFMTMGGGKIDTTVGETRTMIPVCRLATWKGTITGVRIHFDNPGPAKIVIKSFHTACDTRQTVNNLNFIRGCHDYFVWTHDITFLRSQIGRMRSAMRFMQREFDTQNRKCLYTTWPGHEGRSGVRYVDGKKKVIAGEGIGSNYWDILPFGGEDALGTIYYYDTLRDLAELEEQITRHPEWSVATGADAFAPVALRKHAEEVRAYGQKRFWNEKTGRFGTIDLDGNMHDYGFTFLNNEAVYYDFASPEQAKAIHAWIAGERIVEGDTSTGADIYHWRFGPRSTTKRNIDYYFWGYSNPEATPWGYQVQDGGAVLGWTYHDLMARLKTAGADNASPRLSEIAKWFDETQAEGGYRAYYGKNKERGTMQGANVAGGLGLDKEFFESVLMPQVMLYGFLGFMPTVDGFSIDPKLPKNWPALTITHIALHEHVLDIQASQDGTVKISGTGPKDVVLQVSAAQGLKVSASEGLSIAVSTAK
ncbi:MAG TPA: hypothetical protein VGP72_23495 [Planctomycetota bacterium]|jgi:hypothetical protein